MPLGVLGLELQLAVVLCRCWGLNVDPLKEQPVLLTSDLSFQLLLVMIYEAQHTVGAVVLSLQCVAE